MNPVKFGRDGELPGLGFSVLHGHARAVFPFGKEHGPAIGVGSVGPGCIRTIIFHADGYLGIGYRSARLVQYGDDMPVGEVGLVSRRAPVLLYEV